MFVLLYDDNEKKSLGFGIWHSNSSCCLEHPQAIVECLGTSPSCTLDSSFLPMHILEISRWWFKWSSPCSLHRRTGWNFGSWLWPGYYRPSGSDQVYKRFLSPISSLCPSNNNKSTVTFRHVKIWWTEELVFSSGGCFSGHFASDSCLISKRLIRNRQEAGGENPSQSAVSLAGCSRQRLVDEKSWTKVENACKRFEASVVI